MATTTCPAGHESTTDDYCDTCGAPIGAATATPASAAAPAEPEAAAAPAAEIAACPSCGEPVAGRFCESCGYDVESGTPAAPPPVTLVLGTDRAHWERMVGSGEPAFPTVGPTLDFVLTGDRAILGRVRTGAPVDVDLALTGAAADPAVSHNQCVFERDGATWTVSDAGSSNGTWINDATEPLGPGAVHTLADGDRILIGAWTSLTVRIDRGPSTPASTPASTATSGGAATPSTGEPSTSGSAASEAPAHGSADPSAPGSADPSAPGSADPSAPTPSAPPDPS